MGRETYPKLCVPHDGREHLEGGAWSAQDPAHGHALQVKLIPRRRTLQNGNSNKAEEEATAHQWRSRLLRIEPKMQQEPQEPSTACKSSLLHRRIWILVRAEFTRSFPASHGDQHHPPRPLPPPPLPHPPYDACVPLAECETIIRPTDPTDGVTNPPSPKA
ncbi:hypothetical protein BDW22DRAFT_344306 [Trametopsis cervina]|nr:hypothetical protein BDW22DRAFT_344306 [Trametopsis cervina]